MKLTSTPFRHILWRRPVTHITSRAAHGSSIPRVASVWQSVIPKAFRQPDDPVSVAERKKAQAAKSKEWNPATYFIVMALLIGSNAIQMISLRNDRVNFSRKTDAKIALLRETIQRVLDGEQVDVERILGTGDPEQEKEWEQVMRELESDNTLWQGKQRKREAAQQQAQVQQPPSEQTSKIVSQPVPPASESSPRRPGFF